MPVPHWAGVARYRRRPAPGGTTCPLSSVAAARGQFPGKVGSNRECRCRLVTEDGVEKGAKAPSYDDWSVPDLRDKAKQVGIKGRSSMSKKELVSALRDH